MNIIIIVIPLISCYLLRFTHAVTSLLPTPGRNKIIIPCYPAPPPMPCHCSFSHFLCIVAAIYVNFCGFSSLSFPPPMRFHFRFLFCVLCNLPPPSAILPATSAPPAPLLLPLPALFMLHAFDFVLLFFLLLLFAFANFRLN